MIPLGSCCHLSQSFEHQTCAFPHPDILKHQPMFGAQVLDRLGDTVQVVSGDGRKQVVFDLSVQPAREPVVEQRRLDISSRYYLQCDQQSAFV